MEMKELLEQLVKEVAAQNRLLALQISTMICGKYIDFDFIKKDEYLSLLLKEQKIIVWQIESCKVHQ